MDAILRLEYVRNHVARYAQHVMALSPLQPGALGVNIPGEGGSGAGGAAENGKDTASRCVGKEPCLSVVRLGELLAA